MAYKLFKGKQRWQVGGDKPMITILPAGLICFNKTCYEHFVKPTGYKSAKGGYAEGTGMPQKGCIRYVKLYYDAEMKKIAFELLSEKTGERVFPINLTKTGRLAVIKAKDFLTYSGIKYAAEIRSYPVHQTIISKSGSGYKRTWSEVKVKVIEIRLDEYITP